MNVRDGEQSTLDQHVASIIYERLTIPAKVLR
jgi:hypothetical protein